MGVKQEAQLLIAAVTKRSIGFLKEDIEMEVSAIEYNLQDLTSLKLRYLTSLVAVGGNLGMYIAFSFDEPVIRHIFEMFTSDIELDPEDADMYLGDTAGEVINTIIGNALGEMPKGDSVISLTPPVVLSHAKSVSRQKNAYFYTADLQTASGTMSVMCIGPEELFDDKLDYKESGSGAS